MMMMKAAKLGWAGPGAGQEQGRNRAGAELRIVKQSREERGQELGRNLGEARNVQDRSLQGARQEYGRGGAEAGAGEEQREREGETMMMTTMTTTTMMKSIITKRERESHKAARGQPLANIRL